MDQADYFGSTAPKQRTRKAVRSRGSTCSAAALWAQSCCPICCALRFSAASRYSGATAFGSRAKVRAPFDQYRTSATRSGGRVLWSDLFSGFAGISLGSGRTHLAWGPRRSGRSGRTAVLYQDLSFILAAGNLDLACGGEFQSDPPKPPS
jgi:hypothetical protein